MPKIKTKSAAAKRFRVTKSGKFKHGKAFARHNTGKKRAKNTRRLKGTAVVSKSDQVLVDRMLPYRNRAR